MAYDALLKYAEGQTVAGVTAALSDSAVTHGADINIHLYDLHVEILPQAVTGAAATKFELLGADEVDANGDIDTAGTYTVLATLETDCVVGKPIPLRPSKKVSPYTQLRVTHNDAGDSLTFEAGWRRGFDSPHDDS